MGRKADPSEKVSRGQRLWKCYRQEPLGQESRILPLGWLVTHTGRVREVKKGERGQKLAGLQALSDSNLFRSRREGQAG